MSICSPEVIHDVTDSQLKGRASTKERAILEDRTLDHLHSQRTLSRRSFRAWHLITIYLHVF